MSFRRKLLILLLVIALVPLLINGLLHLTTMQRISRTLSTETRDAMQKTATRQLLALVEHQSLLLKRDRALIQQALETQAREVEKLLAAQERPGAEEMTAAYLFAQQQWPELFLWQTTILDRELHSVYPADTLSVSAENSWYQTAKKTLAPHWQLDFTDGQLIFIGAKPLLLGEGDAGGVTAIAIKYQQFFSDWQLPQPWDKQGRLFLVSTDPQVTGAEGQLTVLMEIDVAHNGQDITWKAQELFDAAATKEFKSHIGEMNRNGAGVLTLEFDGKESIWVYAAAAAKDSFPLLIIPLEQVTLPARETAAYVQEQFINGLKLTALLSFGVLLWVIVTAIFRARAVTKPVAQLALAAEQLSQGDFSAQVKIRSNDEFEELGDAFNQIGPQLKERQELKQSLAVARDIQQLILPLEAPQPENFEIAGKLDYCDETGGDYYDFIQTESGKWGLAVGDVVGHGVGAALLMASAAGILKAAIANGHENLEILLTSLNTFLEKDVGDTRFMTLFFALLDPTERSLQWLSAGHGPMFLYRAATGKVEELPATTMPLGVMPDVEFKPIQTEALGSGDILAIGTDGIWETANLDGEMFGSDRVCQLLKEQAQEPAEEIIAAILRAVDNYRGEAAKEDDLTLIILKAK